ncbi:MAG: biotin--[acetyl-CoA-carboxylase] ligase [Oscillospiraceae bacterium]
MTKDKVLIMLKSAGNYVSGEEMSRGLGLSRAAVHMAVEALRRDGYEIKSATNRGYMLISSLDRLSAGEILPFLPEGRGNVFVLDSVDSTNTFLKQEAQKGAPGGTVAVSNEQTGGRGRMGRSFHSPKDKGIYLSMLFRPDCEPAQASGFTAWAAVAVCDCIEKLCAVRPGIKWVNDLLLGGRKVCGILTEMALEGESNRIQYLVTGIGINVNQAPEDFAPEIRRTATSIAAETGRRLDRGRLAAEIINRLDRMYAEFPHKKSEYLDTYRRDCVVPGRHVRVFLGGSQKTAYAEEIDDDFGLVVSYEDGKRETLRSGEISVRGMDGYI